MFPKLFEVGPWTLYTYGVFLWIATASAITVSGLLNHRGLLNRQAYFHLALSAAFAGAIGSRALAILISFGHGSAISSNDLRAGGSLLGGILASFIATLWYVKSNNLQLLPVLDLFAPGLSLGLAIARLGCLAAGCCYGKPTQYRWGITFSNPLAKQLSGTPLGIPLVPTQIIDALVQTFTFFLLLHLTSNRRFSGQVIAVFLLICGIDRCLLGYLRGDLNASFFTRIPLDTSQCLAAVLSIVGLSIWIWQSQRNGLVGAEQVR
ncbi:prolipoprotein diacylglyceryl transferase (plasmid) [Tunturibacter empetritectus]|uniref:Prolipoprotein diacylglyceryl transferase n=1 Tax=Tunturiibacter empetritectus TaxID=3069691 RepID=A0AAU7ZKH7_9BACT